MNNELLDYAITNNGLSFKVITETAVVFYSSRVLLNLIVIYIYVGWIGLSWAIQALSRVCQQ